MDAQELEVPKIISDAALEIAKARLIKLHPQQFRVLLAEAQQELLDRRKEIVWNKKKAK